MAHQQRRPPDGLLARYRYQQRHARQRRRVDRLWRLLGFADWTMLALAGLFLLVALTADWWARLMMGR